MAFYPAGTLHGFGLPLPTTLATGNTTVGPAAGGVAMLQADGYVTVGNTAPASASTYYVCLASMTLTATTAPAIRITSDTLWKTSSATTIVAIGGIYAIDTTDWRITGAATATQVTNLTCEVIRSCDHTASYGTVAATTGTLHAGTQFIVRFRPAGTASGAAL